MAKKNFEMKMMNYCTVHMQNAYEVMRCWKQ